MSSIINATISALGYGKARLCINGANDLPVDNDHCLYVKILKYSNGSNEDYVQNWPLDKYPDGYVRIDNVEEGITSYEATVGTEIVDPLAMDAHATYRVRVKGWQGQFTLNVVKGIAADYLLDSSKDPSLVREPPKVEPQVAPQPQPTMKAAAAPTKDSAILGKILKIVAIILLCLVLFGGIAFMGKALLSSCMSGMGGGAQPQAQQEEEEEDTAEAEEEAEDENTDAQEEEDSATAEAEDETAADASTTEAEEETTSTDTTATDANASNSANNAGAVTAVPCTISEGDDQTLLSTCIKSSPDNAKLMAFTQDALKSDRCDLAKRVLSSKGRSGEITFALTYAKLADPNDATTDKCIPKDKDRAVYWYQKVLEKDPAQADAKSAMEKLQ